MRILVAPDAFTGTLSAVEAAAAIAEGWRRQADDELDLAPMSDGGAGFIDVLQATLGGDLLAATVRGPFGQPGPAAVLLVGGTAYVESAQACGRHLTGGERGEQASSTGVGDLILAATAAGAGRVVVGLGGSGANDGGAGLLGALGATADVPLDAGVAALAGLGALDLDPARERLSGVELIAATDVDQPLTGLFGTTRSGGPDRGIAEERLPAVDGALQVLAEATDRRLALEPGAGGGGGLGFALQLLGATVRPGIDLVADAVGLAERARAADVVLTGEGAFDFSSRAGKVPAGVAAVAADALRPCVALAGQVLVGAREMRALGMDAAYSLVDLVGDDRALTDPAGSLADLAERVARTWSR
jgi:glycerate kinase